MSHKPEKLFGTSGIRGTIKSKMTPSLCSKIGLTAASFFGEDSTILLARDHRPHATVVYHSLISGLLAGGVNILDCGIAPTPAVLFALKKLKYDGAIVVTGSHTPSEIVGILIFKEDTSELSKTESKEFEDILYEERYEIMQWNKTGYIEPIDIFDIYAESVLSLVNLQKVEGRKVAVDPGNGASSVILREILELANIRVVAINDTLDPHFPHRDPFPRPDNLKDLSTITKGFQADIGVGVDGDGDRAIFADENGNILWGDITGSLFIIDALKRKKTKNVVVTINTSAITEWAAKKFGGTVIYSGVGPPAIAESMKKNNAYFGIEESGKYLWSDAIYYGDAALATLRLLEILDIEGKPLSKLISEFPKFYMEKVAISCPDKLKDIVLVRAFEEWQERHKPAKVLPSDGIKFMYKDSSWVLFRPSGTEPVFRVFAESMDKERTKELIKESVDLVKELIKRHSTE
ncbi:MAG: hypothetical protein DRQ02_13125 [Candidatus Latescibacterota bacterium]|nr:phosphoglucosamine mutase [Candidatus Korarchaeota archaeon]RKY63059.1 MAG: hypothetical protein DRQ02_13125 [Candidatus Latescibacterota bacterium]